MSSNTWASSLMPRIIGNSRQYLRRQAVWLKELNHDFSAASGKVGQTIDVPIPQDTDVDDLTPGQLPPVSVGKSFDTTQLTLDKAKISKPFTVEQIHLQNYAISGPDSVLQQQINSGIDAVIGSMATDVWSRYKDVPTFVGTAGTSFFDPTGSAPTINGLANISKALFNQRVPEDRPKMGILSATDFGVLQTVQEVRQAYSIGTDQTITTGQFTPLLGFGVKRDAFAPIHTVGTITTGLAAKTSTVQAAGSASIVATTAASTGACALKAGDMITIGTKNYSLLSDATQASAATDVTLTLDRGLEVALAGDEAITLTTNHGTGRVNLFGDMMGVSVVTRLPSSPESIPEMPVKTMGEHYPIVDPVSGVTVLLSFFGQYFQRTMHVSLVWGTKITHPSRLVRVYSANA